MAKDGAKSDGGNGEVKSPPVTTTAIGPTIVIKGKLKSDEDLIVRGRIEAEIQSSKALLVENSGIIKANVRVKSARISGVLVGNITAEERVELAPDGRMVGDLTAPKIILNDGAAFRGHIDMQNFDEGTDARPALVGARPEARVEAKLDAKNDGKADLKNDTAPISLPPSGGDHTGAIALK
jgi:cytoskeletal protein CcmA (bactofilin family)